MASRIYHMDGVAVIVADIAVLALGRRRMAADEIADGAKFGMPAEHSADAGT